MHPAGEHVLVRAELISTTQGLRLWGASYQPLIQELSLLPSTIALALRDRLGSKQRTGVPRGVSHRSTENSEAYRLYLRGRYFWAKRPGAGYVEKAIELFDEAVALDPAFALAHVGLADCYNTLGAVSYTHLDVYKRQEWNGHQHQAHPFRCDSAFHEQFR